MPKVLITGINGYVGVHTALEFLSHGWSVRGTVRSADKAARVQELAPLAPYVLQGKIEVVVVADLVSGDFSQALDGVDAVAHVASPVFRSTDAWAKARDPAIKGTVRVLEQAATVPSVKAVATMSSFAAMADLFVPYTEQVGKVFTEDDWSPCTEEDCEKGDPADPMDQLVWYCTSKKLAEQAAREAHKLTGEKYSLATICPPLVLGPALHFAAATGEELSKADVSTSLLYTVLAAGRDAPVPDSPYPVWASIHDVVGALYESIARAKTGRYLICSGPYDAQQLADTARRLFPELDKAIPLGTPGVHPSEKGTYTLDRSRSETELGLTYSTTKEDMVKEVMEQFIKIGAVHA